MTALNSGKEIYKVLRWLVNQAIILDWNRRDQLSGEGQIISLDKERMLSMLSMRRFSMKGAENDIYSKRKPWRRKSLSCSRNWDKEVHLQPDWSREWLKMRLERWEVLDHAQKTMIRRVMREGREESRMTHHRYSLSQMIKLNITSKSCW